MAEQYISYGEFLDEIRECYRFKYSRTTSYYLVYNGILFNAKYLEVKEYVRSLIDKLLAEISQIQDTARSPIDSKQIQHHNSNIHIPLRQALNTWALVETSGRVAVIRALAKTLINCKYNDWRFVQAYIDNLVKCLHDQENNCDDIIENSEKIKE
jgi:hypothetical protein